jgi:radical SAM superfamily enzyme
MEKLICQSCGMPMQKDDDFGSNSDGTKNKDYCHFCYENGKFLDEGITMQEKINKNIAIAIKMGIPEDKARTMAENTIPKLKRWMK